MLGVNWSYQSYVKEQLCKDMDVAAQIKSSLQYGGVPRVLGMCLAPLAVVGISGLCRAYSSVVTHFYIAESKKARNSSLQTS